MQEGTLAAWLVEDGLGVEEGQPIYTLEIEKSTLDVEAPAAGVLRHAAAVGRAYKVGEVIGEIDATGDAALSPSPGLAEPSPTVPAGIVDFFHGYMAAYGSGSLDALRPFYTDESFIWPNGRPAVHGWAEVRRMFEPSFAGFEISATVHVQEARPHGSECFLRFVTEVELTPRTGGLPTFVAFRDFAVLACEGGRWTILRNIDQPVSPEQLRADLERSPPVFVAGTKRATTA